MPIPEYALPSIDGARESAMQCAVAPVSTILTPKRWDGYRMEPCAGFGLDVVKRRIMFGQLLHHDAYYLKAQQARTLLKCDSTRPSSSLTVMFKIGEKADDPLSMYLVDAFTCRSIWQATAA